MTWIFTTIKFRILNWWFLRKLRREGRTINTDGLTFHIMPLDDSFIADEDLEPQGTGQKAEDGALTFNLGFTAQGSWGSASLPFRDDDKWMDWVA